MALSLARAAPPFAPEPAEFRARLIEIAEAAGRIAMRAFRPGARTSAMIETKDGGSPVTEADLAVDAYLAEALAQLAGIAYHSEERPASWRGTGGAPAFVVDPIDGTRDFIKGGDVWCIVIGVIDRGQPLAGVVHVPTRGQTFSAFAGAGAYLNGRAIAPLIPQDGAWRATGSRQLADHLGRTLGQTLVAMPPVPALAHRVLLPLTGATDLALAQAGGHDWDIVASDCILAEAGAGLVTLAGERPAYRLEGEEQPMLIAASRAILDKIGAAPLTNPA